MEKACPNPKLTAQVWNHTGGFRVRLFAILLMELLGTPLSLLSPLGIKIAIDTVVGGKPLSSFLQHTVPAALVRTPQRALLFAAALQIAVVLLIQLHGFANYILKMSTGENLVLALRKSLFRHLQRLPIQYHDKHGTADSMFRVQDEAPALKSITVDGALFLISDSIKLLAIGAVTAFIDWHLALLALSVSPLLVLYAAIYQRRVGGRYREVRKMESSAVKTIQEALSAMRVVKAFGQEESEHARFSERSQHALLQRIRLAYADGLFGLSINVTTAAGMALVLYFGIGGVLAGAVTLGSLLMVITYLLQLYAPLQNITYHIASLQTSSASVERAFEILDAAPEAGAQPSAILPVSAGYRSRGAFEFQNVTFSYEPERPVLKEVSLAVPPGTQIGLVGRTGAGKTTLVNLLIRFHEPTSGRILLDGIDLRAYPLPVLRKQFAVVLQDPALFSTTIAENIAYGQPEATREQIVEAAIAANAHPFVMRLPHGYDTQLGERGTLISGGERQRISLARAFLKDAPILILDEPTSSLDNRTEADILEAMKRLVAGRTTFFISHRLSSLADCDLLIKLHDGSASRLRAPSSLHEIENFVLGRLGSAEPALSSAAD